MQPSHRVPSAPRRRALLAGVLGVASLATGPALVASGASGATTSARVAPRLVVSTLTTKQYGTILQSTHTVYTLTPSRVACTSTCAHYWPAVLLPRGVTRAVAGRGVDAHRLGTIRRAGGRLQVTYNGRALYWFAFDTAPGQVHGNVSDTWGKWSVVVLVKPMHVATTTTTHGGAYNY